MKPTLVTLWHSITNEATPSEQALEAFAEAIEKKQDKEIKKLRKHLRDLTANVQAYLRAVDKAMQSPESKQRGENIAKFSNALEMANDRARFFGLGDDWRKAKK